VKSDHKKEIRFSEIRIAQVAMGAEGTPLVGPDGKPLLVDEDIQQDMIVEGYASIFDQPTVLYEYGGVQYSEMVATGAFDDADMSDVAFRYNHDDTVMIMARTRNKTLTLTVDAKGLAIRANLANTTAGRDLYELIGRGDIDKMSIGFIVEEDTYNSDTNLRTINNFARILDVSAVDFPAFDQTSIGIPEATSKRTAGLLAKDYFEGRRVMTEQERFRQSLILATYPDGESRDAMASVASDNKVPDKCEFCPNRTAMSPYPCAMTGKPPTDFICTCVKCCIDECSDCTCGCLKPNCLCTNCPAHQNGVDMQDQMSGNDVLRKKQLVLKTYL
jgi:HK97 family phage prohead protease